MKTQEEINEFNKRCALLIGAYFCNDDLENYPNGYWMIDDDKIDLPHQVEDMQFHSDWNLIHYVIEVIEKLNLNVRITRSCITIENAVDCTLNINTIYKFHSLEGEFETKKEATIAAINEFLTWYEQNK